MSSADGLVPLCPRCETVIWDRAHGHKLHKCWDCGIAYDEVAWGECPGCDGTGWRDCDPSGGIRCTHVGCPHNLRVAAGGTLR